MGYAYYEIDTPEGKPMKRGYSVERKCDQEGCEKIITCGLNCLCYSCTYYFCYEHQVYADSAFECFAGRSHQACKGCDEKYPNLEEEEEEDDVG